MKIAVLTEQAPGERRVALVPESVKKLVAAGFSVCVERGAGVQAHFLDDAYAGAGATQSDEPRALVEGAEIILKVGPPSMSAARDEIAMMRAGQVMVGSLMPTRNAGVMQALAAKGVTAISTDAIPRTTRAQAMDTLSSMANIAGYRGVVMGALELNKYFPMLMTAAGTIFPAKVFLIGAGVAGLQAIATAKRLGAQVFATDVRPEVKEQIESVGGKYVGIELAQSAAAGGGYAKELSEEDRARQRQMLAEQCAVSDVVVTTALIGGVFAPRLIGAEIVRKMKPGSVIVDLAAEGGGNCELSRPGHTVVEHGVKILAPIGVAAEMSTDASILWSRNLLNFVMAYTDTKAKTFALDMNDEIVKGALITHAGQVVHAKTKEAMGRAES
jgi:NAD(P) transhydrogenase subunit alpha